MFLSELLERANGIAQKSYETIVFNATLVQGASVEIHNIQYDSRRVEKGDLFCVLSGIHSHGKLYIDSAIQQGAAAILVEESVFVTIRQQIPLSVGVVVVSDTTVRRVMSLLAKAFFLCDSMIPVMIGITGTDGKTTSVHFVHQLATALGIKAGYWSTIEYHDGKKVHENRYRQSTPESPDIFRCVAMMAKQGCELVVLESTSHGLSHKTLRMIDVSFNFAGLTNIGSEHLDFHGSIEQYVKDKSNLFSQLHAQKEQAVGFVRYEETYKQKCIDRANSVKAKVATYSIVDNNAEYYVDITKESLSYLKGIVWYRSAAHSEHNGHTEVSYSSEICLHCFGRFNMENALLAIALLHAYCCAYCNEESEHAFYRVCHSVSLLQAPAGRMQTIAHTKPFSVIIDYAHTPQSFMSLFPIVAQKTEGRLIVVFGSAGERDVQKRKEQGSIADKYADIIVLTDEDPRGETPMDILQQIAESCVHHEYNSTLFLIPDREKAIAFALSLAEEGDSVLLLGKGHEKSIEYSMQKKIAWDEATIVKKYLS